MIYLSCSGGGGKYLIDAPNSFDRAVLNQRYIFTPPSLPRGAFKAPASFYQTQQHPAVLNNNNPPKRTFVQFVDGRMPWMDGLFPEPT